MTNLITLERATILPSVGEMRVAQESSRKLAAYYQNQESILLHLFSQHQQAAETIELPASVLRLLLDILAQMANGNAVQLTPIQADCTPFIATCQLYRLSRLVVEPTTTCAFAACIGWFADE